MSRTDTLTERKLCENYPSAQRNTWHVFKVIRSNTESAITPRRIGRFCWNLVREFNHITAHTLQMLTNKITEQFHSHVNSMFNVFVVMMLHSRPHCVSCRVGLVLFYCGAICTNLQRFVQNPQIFRRDTVKLQSALCILLGHYLYVEVR